MKATIVITAAVLSLQVSVLFAGNIMSPVTTNSNAFESKCISLMPLVPAEATFEDEAALTDFSMFAPVAPKEADFNDDVDAVNTVMIQNLAPVTPAEADFNDAEMEQGLDLNAVAPATPAEADFSDLL
jgi:hypothetical protein